MARLAAFLLFLVPFCTGEVVTRPTPPQNVTATVLSGSAVRVQWKPPVQSHGNITHYVIEYRISSTKFLQWITEGSTLQYDINKLKADTDYHFTVSAQNAAGVGRPSPPIFVRTLKVSTPPQNVTATVLSRSSVRVQWEPPAQSIGNLTSYLVVVLSSPTYSSQLGVDHIALQTVVNDLWADTKYQVTVAAVTTSGEGRPSAPCIVYTQLVPTPPQNVSATALSSSTVRVQWLPPAQVLGNLTNYTVTLQPVTRPPTPTAPLHTAVMTVNGSTLQSDVNHLLNDTAYQVTVIAASSEGQGTPSTALVVQTLPNGQNDYTDWTKYVMGILTLVTTVILIIFIICFLIKKNKRNAGTVYTTENDPLMVN